jgi:CHAT domain
VEWVHGLKPSRNRILHLAVHGVANTAFLDRAALVPGGSSHSGEDGLLQVREIRDLPPRDELVTLSACDTGTGKLLGQEGIASVERAFLLAGAKAVIASLWPADETFTIGLMKRMYQHLVDGVDKGVSLRQAKLGSSERVRRSGTSYILGRIHTGRRDRPQSSSKKFRTASSFGNNRDEERPRRGADKLGVGAHLWLANYKLGSKAAFSFIDTIRACVI